MKSPNEKAKELVDKLTLSSNAQDGSWMCLDLAKQCALICVDEIIKAIDFDWMQVQNLERQHAYWDKVKQEIENL